MGIRLPALPTSWVHNQPQMKLCLQKFFTDSEVLAEEVAAFACPQSTNTCGHIPNGPIQVSVCPSLCPSLTEP